jgi:hypothetical protein
MSAPLSRSGSSFDPRRPLKLTLPYQQHHLNPDRLEGSNLLESVLVILDLQF